MARSWPCVFPLLLAACASPVAPSRALQTAPLAPPRRLDAPGSSAPSSTPAAALEIGGSRIVAGEKHTCVARRDGAVWCWGNNEIGQVDGHAKSRAPGFAPTRIVEAEGALRLSVSPIHTCALQRGGFAACWGPNQAGELGSEPDLGSSFVHLPFTGVRGIFAGINASCLSQSDRGLLCWGKNASSRLGRPERGLDSVGPTGHAELVSIGPIPGIADAVQVAFGEFHVCALSADGHVDCLGLDNFGQLGVGAVDFSGAPHPARRVPSLTDVVQLEAEGFTTCARKRDGTVWCWGRDVGGQLGLPASWVLPREWRTKDRFAAVPQRVPGLPPARHISIGGSHACAVGLDGAAYCWGANAGGQLGDGTTESRPAPVRVQGITSAVAVAAGLDFPRAHTCFLLEDDQVACVGSNDSRQLGVAEPPQTTTPLIVPL